MKPDIEELRRKYIENPPEGMTSMDIRHMSEEDLLDMDYFLNEDVFGDDFVFSKTMIICLLCPLLCGLFFFWKGAKGELSYKAKRKRP